MLAKSMTKTDHKYGYFKAYSSMLAQLRSQLKLLIQSHQTVAW